MSTVKRVFFYTVSFISLGIFAGGAGVLLALCFDILVRRENWANFAREQLSLGLAMLITGGVLWFLFWRATQRQVSGNPDEVGSAIRKLFLNVVRGVAALIYLTSAAGFLVWLMSGVSIRVFPSTELAMLVVGGGLWYYHWWVEEREGQPTPDARTLKRWYVYVLSGFGLVSLATGLIQLVNAAAFYLPVWGGNVVQGEFWTDSVKWNVSWILIGGLTWVFHWFYMAKGDYDSTLRQVYLYLLTILGGALAGLTALTMTLFNVFRFAFDGVSAAGDRYFLFLGWTIPTMLVAAAVWMYHQKAVQEEAAQLPERQLSARRVYLYLMSFIGLGTWVAGLIILLGIFLNMIINAVGGGTAEVAAGWWRTGLSVCLALLLVGAPIWVFYWRRVLQVAAEGGVVERGARSRRIFLYVVLGVAVVTLAADVVNIVYQLLNGFLQGAFGVRILRNLDWSLQTLLIPLPILLYHWRVLRQDQRLGAEKVSLKKTVTLLAGEPESGLVSRIEEKLGYRIQLLRHLSQPAEEIPALSDEEVETLVNNVQAAPGVKVMLVVAGGQVLVLPYQEK